MLRHLHQYDLEFYKSLNRYTLNAIFNFLVSLKQETEYRKNFNQFALYDAIIEIINILKLNKSTLCFKRIDRYTLDCFLTMMKEEAIQRYNDIDATTYTQEHGEAMEKLMHRVKSQFIRRV